MKTINIAPCFITCATEKICYLRGEDVINNPVNISLCTSISKSKFAWYPDNDGRPAIKFHSCNVEWVYDNEDERDEEFKKISENIFGE